MMRNSIKLFFYNLELINASLENEFFSLFNLANSFLLYFFLIAYILLSIFPAYRLVALHLNLSSNFANATMSYISNY